MKKIICLALCLVMALSTLALVACDSSAGAVKLGLGLHIQMAKATDASLEDGTNKPICGVGQVVITAAAVTLDKNGKILDCAVDCADVEVEYTPDGKAIAQSEIKTKYERGNEYGMSDAGKKEWYVQADAFESVVKGKTLDEVKALVVDNYKGNDEVISAGCTMGINEFVLAIEKACNGAVECAAKTSDKLSLAINTSLTSTDADEDVNGSQKAETTIFAGCIGADGKITAATNDAVEATFSFNSKGESETDLSAFKGSKRQQGDKYGMSDEGKKEWHVQADAFAACLIGKTAGDAASLMGADGKGTADVQTAGCTIYVSGFVKAAAKLK